MEHFYHRNAGLMTLPEFLGALKAIGKVRDELKPKTIEEIHARKIAETMKRQKEALEEKMANKARRGGS